MKFKILTMVILAAILLIGALGVAQVAALAQTEPDGQEYVVQANDWLSRLAEKFYGDVMAYPTIVEATNAKAAEDNSFAVINNPDVIEVGQKLWIPNAPAGGTAPAQERGNSRCRNSRSGKRFTAGQLYAAWRGCLS
jgi:LysM repeat protein